MATAVRADHRHLGLEIFRSVETLTGANSSEELYELGFDLVVTLFSGLWVLISPVYAVILRALCYRSGAREPNR